MILLLCLLMMIFYMSFIKMLIISEIIMSFFMMKMIFKKIELINFSMIFITIMVLESCLGIFLLFEFMNQNKIFFFNTNFF